MHNSPWVAACRTHRGNYRRCNEDAVMSCSKESIWAVADGMGGHSAGDLASQTIVDVLNPENIQKSIAALADRVDWIEDRLLLADNELHMRAKRMGPGSVIGSTVVSLTIEGSTGVVLWAGDSRLYRLRNGRLHLVTRDHNPIADLLGTGAVTEAEVLATDTNVITRAVGGRSPLDLDVAVFDVEPTDTLLLCTDGLYRELEDWELSNILSQDNIEAAATELVELTLTRAARDNLSVLALRGAAHVSR